MPHIIVEYTDHLNLDVEKLTIELHRSLIQQDTIKEEAVKTRAIPVKATVVGTGKCHDKFIHICLKLMPGRDDALRRTMAEALAVTVRKIALDENISITVETAELHAESYIK
jgi:5-carboxymethyl-2-hydroxymuconate isomerase